MAASDPRKSQRPRNESGLSIWVVAAIAIAIIILWTMRSQPRKDMGPYVGQPLPPLHAAGWLNAARPITDADLAGKVVLVDYWATRCGPCVAGIPDVIAFHKRFRDSGVMVIGLTSESGGEVETVKNFVNSRDGMAWPIGYGAGMTMQMMGIHAIPTYMLYDRSGVCVWGGHSLNGVEDAAVRALAK